IFRLPAGMAAQVRSPWLLLGVWALAGVLSLCGALTFAEMGGMFPRAGGQYVFLREAFGDRVAFLYGWSFFWVIQTGIIAAVAVAGAFFAYDGWNQSAFVAGEVRDPQRNVPRSMMLGVLVVMLVYLLANVVYLHVLPMGPIVHGGPGGGPTPTLASDVAKVLFG